MVQRFAQVVLTREHERLNRLFRYLVPADLSPPPQIGSRVWVPFNQEHLDGFVVGFTDQAPTHEAKAIAQVLGQGPVFSPEQIELAQWMAEYYVCPLVRALKAMLPPAPPAQGKIMVRLVQLGEEEWLEILAYWEKMHPAAARILNYLADKGEVPTRQLNRLGISDWEEILKQLAKQGLLLLETRPRQRREAVEEPYLKLTLSRAEALEMVEKLRRRAPRQAEILTVLAAEGPTRPADLFRNSKLSRAALPALLAKGLIKKDTGAAEESGAGRPFNSVKTVAATETNDAIETPAAAEVPKGAAASATSLITEAEVAATAEGKEAGAPAAIVAAKQRDAVRPSPWTLTPEQKQALEQIQQALLQVDAGIPAKPIVLQGVTGSGKTEVYLQAIETVLQQGRTAIVLVPEISLTPQTAERFRQRFGSRVSVMHSRLSAGERQREWNLLKDGIVDIVVGARSALFAPVERLGLIILDEEHENSFKQDRAPRYHTREVAIKRAELTGAVVLLGTATPTVESYYAAQKGDFSLIKLTQRVQSRPLPQIEVVDLRQELQEGNRSMFSRALQAGLTEVLANGEQAILFLNRRGFASFVNCRNCGLVLRCPNCAVSLTYHQPNQRLRCHYCDYQRPLPRICPDCQSNYLRHFGIGTQRVEDEVRRLFPEARTLRVDVDTTMGRGFYEEFFRAFKQREIDILVGTQLIAKGLDFPGVTLVGVVTADTSLNLPDFRAAERTYQLLTQVAGRAGRGNRPGKVIFQTYTPQHYSLLTAQHQDPEAFYRAELQNRQQWQYPPCWAMIRIVVSGLAEKPVQMAAELLGRYLAKQINRENERNAAIGLEPALELLGPTAAPMVKVRNNYRWHLIVKGADRDKARQAVSKGIEDFKAKNQGRQVQIAVDVDPLNML